MDVLDDRVKPVLLKLCENKKADEFVFVNPKAKNLTLTSKDRSLRRAIKRKSETSNGMISELRFVLG
jgi:hypothetical protein